jgi:hypothetical protein
MSTSYVYHRYSLDAKMEELIADAARLARHI